MNWEKFYQENGENAMMQFPFSIVIELLRFYKKKYPDIENNKINVLEVGCGSGSNLKYAASLGFNVYGIDISNTAIEYTKKSFKESGLKGNFLVSGAESLPFEDDFFHIVIDHGALVCVKEDLYKKAIDEIYRVSKKGSISLLSPHSEISTPSMKLYKEDIYDGFVPFKNGYVYINEIDLKSVINILNNRYKVVFLRRINRVDYNISADYKTVDNESTTSIFYLFIEK